MGKQRKMGIDEKKHRVEKKRRNPRIREKFYSLTSSVVEGSKAVEKG